MQRPTAKPQTRARSTIRTAVLGVVACLVGLSAVVAPPGARADVTVRSLIVQYAPGRVPTDTVPILGSSKVSADLRRSLRLGSALGNNMWRVDFVDPVPRSVATRVARQLEQHRFIVFATIDEPVGAFSPGSAKSSSGSGSSG